MKKRILVCAYFAQNMGDDLFLKVLFDRYPNVEWDLLTGNRNYNRIFKDYINVHIIYTYRKIGIGKQKINLYFMLNDIAWDFKKYDALVNIGGSIFKQGVAWRKKLKEREYLVNKFKQMNKKTYVIGANFGPYKDDDFIKDYKELFKKYDDICFRDQYSYQIFKGLGNVRVAPDAVFNLKEINLQDREKSIGFSVINLEGREELSNYYNPYNNKMIELAESFLSKGYKIKLFSFCENEGDLSIINIIKSSINMEHRSNVTIINYEGDIEAFLDEFNSCGAIIGTRFHSIILALLNNQSVYPIIYSDKTFHVLKDLNLESHCCHVRDMEGLDVERVVEFALHNRVKDRQFIGEADKQFEKLDMLLN